MDTLCLITPTGGRPEAFALLEKWMARQSRKWDQWIVVDDQFPRTVCTLGQEVLCPKWSGLEANTQDINLLMALDHAKCGVIAFIEDDDWYGPTYLEAMMEAVWDNPLVGLSYSKQYNAALRMYRPWFNYSTSPLASTVIDEALISEIRKPLNAGAKFADMELWHSPFAKKWGKVFEPSMQLHVGMKGMPGRYGIGGGHDGANMLPDFDLKYLRGLIGNDADDYARFYKQEGK